MEMSRTIPKQLIHFHDLVLTAVINSFAYDFTCHVPMRKMVVYQMKQTSVHVFDKLIMHYMVTK
jgi:hypothetical protein